MFYVSVYRAPKECWWGCIFGDLVLRILAIHTQPRGPEPWALGLGFMVLSGLGV